MPKRGNGEGSIYQMKDGRWRAAVTVGWDEDGNARRKTFTARTRRQVQDLLNDALHAQARGLRIDPERMTVSQYLDRWMAECMKPKLRPSTFDSYSRLIRKHVKPALGRYILQKLSPAAIQGFMNDRLAAGLSGRTVQYLRAILRSALNQALKWEMVSRNVATLVDPPKVDHKEIRPFTPEQAKAFLDAVRGHRLEALYSVAIAIGLRQGEALGLRWADIDLEKGELAVRYALQRVQGKLVLVEPKTSRSRRLITLPQIAVSALYAHKVRQEEERQWACDRWTDTGFVFTSTVGTPLDTRNVTKQFQALLALAGLPRLRFHDLRHTCATLLLAQGVHARTVMETLGHSQISLTMNTYGHVIPAMGKEAAAKIDEILAPQGAARGSRMIHKTN